MLAITPRGLVRGLRTPQMLERQAQQGNKDETFANSANTSAAVN
jgi:hypothetical protein